MDSVQGIKYSDKKHDSLGYRKWEKIRWAKYSRFQPYEVFHGNTFAVPWPAVFIV